MIVNELNVVALAIVPPQYDSPLVIDANAMKPRPATTKCLEPISRWRAEIPKLLSRIDQV